jgi:hypothetical protein
MEFKFFVLHSVFFEICFGNFCPVANLSVKQKMKGLFVFILFVIWASAELQFTGLNLAGLEFGSKIKNLPV